MIFIDSSAFIAAFYPEDEMHEQAKKIMPQLYESGEATITSDHVLDETLTFLNRRLGNEFAVGAADRILNMGIEMAFCNFDYMQETVSLLKKYRQLSFCDCFSTILMQKKGIRKIFSFDSDFDKIPGIKRLC